MKAWLLKLFITNMTIRVNKNILIATFILLTISVVGVFPVGHLVLAQELNKKSGQLVGGHSDVIPVQLKRGEMIEGTMIATNEPLTVTVEDPEGREVQDYGSMTRGPFRYAAAIDGEHRIVITNPNPITVRARGYSVSWQILSATVPPGSGSGNISIWTRIFSFIKPYLWIIGLILFFLLLAAPVREKHEEEYDWVWFYYTRIIIGFRRRR